MANNDYIVAVAKNGIYETLGRFDDYANAVMFRETYNKFYKADAIIIDKWARVHTSISEKV